MMRFSDRFGDVGGFCRDLWYRMPGRGLLLWLIGLALLAAVITVVALLIRSANRHKYGGPAMHGMHPNDVRPFAGDNQVQEAKQALAILNERYARGEIDDDEYQRRKANLTGSK